MTRLKSVAHLQPLPASTSITVDRDLTLTSTMIPLNTSRLRAVLRPTLPLSAAPARHAAPLSVAVPPLGRRSMLDPTVPVVVQVDAQTLSAARPPLVPAEPQCFPVPPALVTITSPRATMHRLPSPLPISKRSAVRRHLCAVPKHAPLGQNLSVILPLLTSQMHQGRTAAHRKQAHAISLSGPAVPQLRSIFLHPIMEQ